MKKFYPALMLLNKLAADGDYLALLGGTQQMLQHDLPIEVALRVSMLHNAARRLQAHNFANCGAQARATMGRLAEVGA